MSTKKHFVILSLAFSHSETFSVILSEAKNPNIPSPNNNGGCIYATATLSIANIKLILFSPNFKKFGKQAVRHRSR